MITLYESIDKGIALNQPQLNTASLTFAQLRGFFLKSDLQQILNLPGCVGIRFYNINPTTGMPRIIAGAAKSDGFEVETFYLESNNFIGSDLNMPANRITNKVDARNMADATPSETQFMSFFSKDELELNLLNGTHDGVSFYQINLDIISDIDLRLKNQDHLVPIKDKTETHIAVPANLVGGALQLIAPTINNLVSIHPCPGHCLKKQETSTSRGRFPVPGSNLVTGDPYLFKWHDYEKDLNGSN